MKFHFPESDPKTIQNKIMEALGVRELGKMVSFEVDKKQLFITISKLGTSTLVFNHKEEKGGRFFELESEKIAFTHKAFKDEVKEKLCRVIEKCGGKIIET